jgi:hypothetical protein
MSLIDSLSRAKDFKQLIDQKLDGLAFGAEPKCKVSAGLLHLSIEHFASILLLVERHLNASAAALLRPQYEAAVRGVYFDDCATPEEIDSFVAGQEPVNLSEMIKRIDAHNSSNALCRFKDKFLDTMHGFTHGGFEQLQRRYTGAVLAANFTDSEREEIVRVSHVLAGVAATCAAAIADNQALVQDLLSSLNVNAGEP